MKERLLSRPDINIAVPLLRDDVSCSRKHVAFFVPLLPHAGFTIRGKHMANMSQYTPMSHTDDILDPFVPLVQGWYYLGDQIKSAPPWLGNRDWNDLAVGHR